MRYLYGFPRNVIELMEGMKAATMTDKSSAVDMKVKGTAVQQRPVTITNITLYMIMAPSITNKSKEEGLRKEETMIVFFFCDAYNQGTTNYY